jgi:hypothetical protein
MAWGRGAARQRGAGHPLWAQVAQSVSTGACFGARRAVNTRLPALRRTHSADGATFAHERMACPALRSRSVAAHRSATLATAMITETRKQEKGNP